MSDFPNLRGNFTHVVESASLRDLHVLLSVLHDEFATRHHGITHHLGRAADMLASLLRTRTEQVPPTDPAT